MAIIQTIGGDAIEARRHVPPQILGPGGTLWSMPPPISAVSFVIVFSMDNTLLTVTDYTQLICGLVECVMPASLYSQQSCSFVNMVGLNPVLAAQNA